jgi:hypothetical protein
VLLEKIAPKSVYDKQECYHLNAIIKDWNRDAPVVRRTLGDYAIPTDSEMQAILVDAYTEDYLDGTKADLFIDKANRAMVLQASRTLLTLLTSGSETSDPSELRALLFARIPSRYTDRALSDTHSDLKTIKHAYKKTKRTLSEVVLSPKCQDTWVTVSTTMDALLGRMPPNFNREHLAHLIGPILSRAGKLLDAAQTVRFLNSDTDAPSKSVEAADSLLVLAANNLTSLATEAAEIMRLVIEADAITAAREMRL